MTGPVPDWSPQLRGLADAASGLLAALTATVTADPVTSDAAPGDHAAECRTCPVCTALAVLRGRRPDLSEALADVLATAATALRAHARPDGSRPDGSRPDESLPDPCVPEPGLHGEHASPTPPPAPVQHIEVA